MTHYFVTGYSDGHELNRVQITPAPADPVERVRAFDALLYAPEAQDGGRLAFTISMDDEGAALREGRKAHAAWLAGDTPDAR